MHNMETVDLTYVVGLHSPGSIQILSLNAFIRGLRLKGYKA